MSHEIRLGKGRNRKEWKPWTITAAIKVGSGLCRAAKPRWPKQRIAVWLDGVPINENGMARDRVTWTDHVFLPPAARVEFIFKGMPKGAQAQLITRSVDTGPAGENDPALLLANVIASDSTSEPQLHLASFPEPMPASTAVWLGNVKPVRTRKLYFSERPTNPSLPDSPTVFMITEDEKPRAPFDPHAVEPDIPVHEGDVEDWVIENRSTEAHAFHIHQIHFMLTQWNGLDVDEPLLRDIINIPHWRGKGTPYPSVTLRMDFRDPNAVGTFVYHCHLLEHEDGGMMGQFVFWLTRRHRRLLQSHSSGGPQRIATISVPSCGSYPQEGFWLSDAERITLSHPRKSS